MVLIDLLLKYKLFFFLKFLKCLFGEGNYILFVPRLSTLLDRFHFGTRGLPRSLSFVSEDHTLPK